MWLSFRRWFSIFSLIVSIIALRYYYYQQQFSFLKVKSRLLPITRDTITSLDNRTFIISPYFEPRDGPSIRVLAILHDSVKELYCCFHCLPNQTVSIRASIDLHGDRFGFRYGAADLLCAEPPECDYTYMTFHYSKVTNTSQNTMFRVKNRPLPPISANFTVCLSTLYGNYDNVLQVVQSIEMYKIMGASKVTIYNTSCSQNLDKVLRHYMDEGTLEVVPWPIDRHLRTAKGWRHSKVPTAEIGYFGQTATLNDCLYRNMYKSKFLLLNDIDEVILPVTEWDWSSLMEKLQNQYPDTSVFFFENHIYPVSANISGFNLWSHVPGVNILLHSLREPMNRKMFNGRKMIMNPRNVFQTSVHSALKQSGDWKSIPPNVALTFHCTHTYRRDLTVKDLIPDNIVRRHNMSLVPNVDKVIQKLFPQH
ncbi:beta-1,4-galactosyltransferase galt-1-like [Mantella aurantiaca]